ncbi:MAG: hypothetical protein B0A82_00320 [Alkalinema sp. CACIAM 70d]|nr:MAG: hypothetical protein B0A82_00320 [Alkalinema sp. CACIAM 70d]
MSQVLELAKQGDAKAIAALMNHQLRSQNIVAKVVVQEHRVKVMLEGLSVPEQSALTQFVTQGLQHLALPQIQHLEIYGRRMGESQPAWKQGVSLAMAGATIPPQSTVADPSPSQDRSSTASPAASIVPDTRLTSPPYNPAETAAPIEMTTAECSSNPTFSGSLVERAQQGDEAAIAEFVQQALADRPNLESAIELNDGKLKITLTTSEFLDGQAFAAEFGKKLNEIASTQVREAAIYKQRSAKANPFLVKEMTLVPTVANSTKTAESNSAATIEMAASPQATPTTQAHRGTTHTSSNNSQFGQKTGVANTMQTPFAPKGPSLEWSKIFGEILLGFFFRRRLTGVGAIGTVLAICIKVGMVWMFPPGQLGKGTVLSDHTASGKVENTGGRTVNLKGAAALWDPKQKKLMISMLPVSVTSGDVKELKMLVTDPDMVAIPEESPASLLAVGRPATDRKTFAGMPAVQFNVQFDPTATKFTGASTSQFQLEATLPLKENEWKTAKLMCETACSSGASGLSIKTFEPREGGKLDLMLTGTAEDKSKVNIKVSTKVYIQEMAAPTKISEKSDQEQ